MANEQNLIPLNQRTQRERKEIATKGAEATNKARREKKKAVEVARLILDEIINTKGGEAVEVRYAMIKKQVERALKHGDTKAFNAVIKLADEMPSDKHEISGDMVLTINTTAKGAIAMQALNELDNE